MTAAEVIAFNCYRSFGASDKESHLAQSVVGWVNRMVSDNVVNYTQRYFYEETCFIAILIMEAQYRFGYIDWITRTAQKEGVISENPSPDDIRQMLYSMVYWIAGQRMQAAGVPQTETIGDVDEMIANRIVVYEKLMKESLESEDDVPRSGFGNVLDSTSHPFQKYLHVVANNIKVSLTVDEKGMNPIFEALVDQAVVLKWTSHMEAAATLSGAASEMQNFAINSASLRPVHLTEPLNPEGQPVCTGNNVKKIKNNDGPLRRIWLSTLLGLSVLVIFVWYPYSWLVNKLEWRHIGGLVAFGLLGLYAYMSLFHQDTDN